MCKNEEGEVWFHGSSFAARMARTGKVLELKEPDVGP